MTAPEEGPYRDGRVHVRQERCSTCVFRPGNLMRLNPGRLADLVESNLAADSALQCHQTLPAYGDAALPPAVCRGFYDHPRADESMPLRAARFLGIVEFDQCTCTVVCESETEDGCAYCRTADPELPCPNLDGDR